MGTGSPAIPSTPSNIASPTTRWSTTSTSLTNTGVPPLQRARRARPRVLTGWPAERTAGAHPYNTNPNHTDRPAEISGPNALLLPEHNCVCRRPTPRSALWVVRKVSAHFTLPPPHELVNNFKRLGFTDADLTRPGSDKFVEPWSPPAPEYIRQAPRRSICGPAPTTS